MSSLWRTCISVWYFKSASACTCIHTWVEIPACMSEYFKRGNANTCSPHFEEIISVMFTSGLRNCHISVRKMACKVWRWWRDHQRTGTIWCFYWKTLEGWDTQADRGRSWRPIRRYCNSSSGQGPVNLIFWKKTHGCVVQAHATLVWLFTFLSLHVLWPLLYLKHFYLIILFSCRAFINLSQIPVSTGIACMSLLMPNKFPLTCHCLPGSLNTFTGLPSITCPVHFAHSTPPIWFVLLFPPKVIFPDALQVQMDTL